MTRLVIAFVVMFICLVLVMFGSALIGATALEDMEKPDPRLGVLLVLIGAGVMAILTGNLAS